MGSLEYIILAAVILTILFLAYIMMFRRSRLEIITIPSRDLLSDNVMREIIMVIGGSGDEGIKQSSLASILGKPKSTISRKVRRLHEEGYVEIIRKGKANILKLTEKGWEAYNRLRESS